MASSLDQLKQHTVVVADSGDFATIAEFKPQDATTNPSLILAASKKEQYAKLIDQAIEYAKKEKASADIDTQVDAALDRLLVEFGKEILAIIPGKVSTEVDARFSFDTKASVDKALHLIEVSCGCNIHFETPKTTDMELTDCFPPFSSSTSSRASPRTAS